MTDFLQKVLDHIPFVFQTYYNFPKWLIDQVLHQEKTTTLFEVYNLKKTMSAMKSVIF